MILYFNVKSIRKYCHFKELKKSGKRYKKQFFDLIVTQCNEYKNEDFGLAVITSKKIGKAVKRNKTRRWIKEYFRKPEISILKNFNYLVITKPGIVDYKRENILSDIEDVLEKFRENNL